MYVSSQDAIDDLDESKDEAHAERNWLSVGFVILRVAAMVGGAWWILATSI